LGSFGVSDAIGMLAAIDLDDQPLPDRSKIRYVRPNRALPAELVAGQAPIAQREP
jgi:hypothetical protein